MFNLLNNRLMLRFLFIFLVLATGSSCLTPFIFEGDWRVISFSTFAVFLATLIAGSIVVAFVYSFSSLGLKLRILRTEDQLGLTPVGKRARSVFFGKKVKENAYV